MSVCISTVKKLNHTVLPQQQIRFTEFGQLLDRGWSAFFSTLDERFPSSQRLLRLQVRANVSICVQSFDIVLKRNSTLR